NTLAQAEQVLRCGQADLVSMARPFLADPHILTTSFAGRAELVNTCIGCNEACIDRSFGPEPVSCMVNPRAGRELEFPAGPDLVQRPAGEADGAGAGAYDSAPTGVGRNAGSDPGVCIAVV